ncbi:MAG: response regulator [Alphaproteobacteria bacterium]|nr:MAG: response regulator [Alphaproteobacteria bacterium]
MRTPPPAMEKAKPQQPARPDRRLVQEAMDALYLGQLGAISAVIAGYYLFLAISHSFFLAPDIKAPMIGIALLTTLVGTAVSVLSRTGRISARHSHVALLPPALLSALNVFMHAWLSGDQLQLSNSVLMFLAYGVITLSPPVFGILLAASAAGTFFVLFATPGANTVHLTFLLVGGLILSVLCFTQRYRTLWRVQQLSIADRDKAGVLEALNWAISEQVKEAREAAEEARRANEAKDIFLANTSHELRTPLTGVLGMLEVLSLSGLSREQREAVDAAQFSAQTLLAVINDVLDLARMDAGKLELKIQPFNPVELVVTVAGLLEPRADEKHLNLELQMPKRQIPTLMGDPIRIGQILFNFLSNAIKFTDTGTVTVQLQAVGDGDLCHMRLGVRDTGVGFDQAEKDRLFERFFQADGSASRMQGGTGLGLAICRELADLMGGEIEAESSPGAGADFSLTVSLPKATQPVATEDKAQARHQTEPTGPLAVLVAEDNQINQMLVRKYAERLGWHLTIVDNGEKAVEAVAGGGLFDLVLMDVRMPVMDGVTATRAIRALDGPVAKLPIVALTANTMPEDKKAYVAAGMNAVVGKPVQLHELTSAVRQVLALKAGKGA